MKWILTLFFASTCFGQLTTQSMQPFFHGTSSTLTPCQVALGSGFPTNIAGYPAYGWWVAGCYFTNGSSVAVLTDYSLNNLDLTNATVGNSPTAQPNVFNGFSGVWMGQTAGTHTLVNTFGTWIPSGNLAEFWCVMSYTNSSNVGTWLFHDVSGNNTGLQVEHFRGASPNLSMNNGATAADAIGPLTNRYALFNFVFTQGANTTIFTNDVQGVNVNIGSGPLASFRLAGGLNANSPMNFSFLEGGWYRTNLTAAGRLALYQYVTNKYVQIP